MTGKIFCKDCNWFDKDNVTDEGEIVCTKEEKIIDRETNEEITTGWIRFCKQKNSKYECSDYLEIKKEN